MKLLIICLLVVVVGRLKCSSLVERNTNRTETKETCVDSKELLDKINGLLQTYLGDSDKSASLPDTTKRTGRATYIQWGKASCTGGSSLVYTGYAGGNYYNHGSAYKGGPANTLCLPKEPIYAKYTKGHSGYSYIYGAEYADTRTSPNIKRLLRDDVPCAVCQTRGESNVIMIPARNECYPGWKVKYWGYLMSDYYAYTASEYICVDHEAEPTTGGKETKHGRLLWLVESKCGSLPCPPYIEGLEVTCVVCAN